ncbi:hypothetical protein AB6831_04120 [Carnobacterium divergens]|uniref:hypothetical protein n=1 Tax=Carnobacterium divergens TaxID=2748 RepID=UPI0039C9F9B4
MTKIDETKQYKLSEIVRMLEDSELPKGTILTSELYPNSYPLIVEEALYCDTLFNKSGDSPELSSRLIRNSWTIKLPKEDKFYLKAPESFGSSYLNYNIITNNYTIFTKSETKLCKTKFTQSEIDAMSFDTNFFGEPIKVEDENNDSQ